MQFLLLPQQNSICVHLFTCFSSIAFSFTKPSNLSKFPLLQMNPYQTCINELSSWCMHPHPLLTVHDLTHIKLAAQHKVPIVLPVCCYVSISNSTKGAPEHASSHEMSMKMLVFCVNIQCTGI